MARYGTEAEFNANATSALNDAVAQVFSKGNMDDIGRWQMHDDAQSFMLITWAVDSQPVACWVVVDMSDPDDDHAVAYLTEVEATRYGLNVRDVGI